MIKKRREGRKNGRGKMKQLMLGNTAVARGLYEAYGFKCGSRRNQPWLCIYIFGSKWEPGMYDQSKGKTVSQPRKILNKNKIRMLTEEEVSEL